MSAEPTAMSKSQTSPRQPLKKLMIILGKEPVWELLHHHARTVWAHLRQPRGVSGTLIWPPTRYLRAYMSRSLSHQARRQIVLSQAAHLDARVHRSFFREIAHPRAALWRFAQERCCSIWLVANQGRHLEGDFDLVFQLDGMAIYALSFSIGPSPANPPADRPAMLVGRVQGERGHFDDIRLATKVLKDISPAALLVSAAEGIALALNLTQICGVGGCEQLAHLKAGADYFDYDEFWEALSGRRIRDWYVFDAPFPHKPPSGTAAHHRRRARRKRVFRDAVREEVRATFVERFVRQEPPRAEASALAAPFGLRELDLSAGLEA